MIHAGIHAPVLPRDVHLRCLAALLLLVSLPLLAMLVLTPVAVGRLLLFPPALPAEDVRVAWVVLPLCFALGVYGLGLALVARGLARRRLWAAPLAALACVSLVALGLIPLGAYGAFALLRPAVRELWWRARPQHS